MFSVCQSIPDWSLPLRKCGLKSVPPCRSGEGLGVTSLAEVWIEMQELKNTGAVGAVTSLAEVWIEITTYMDLNIDQESLPLRKCGLKLHNEQTQHNFQPLSLPLRKCGLKC